MPGLPVQCPTHIVSLRGVQGGVGAVCARARCTTQVVGACDGAVRSAAAVMQRCLLMWRSQLCLSGLCSGPPIQPHCGAVKVVMGQCARVRSAPRRRPGVRRCWGSAAAVVQGSLQCGAPSYAWAACGVDHSSSFTYGECRAVLGQSACMRAAPRRQ